MLSPNHPQVKTNLHPSPHDIPPLRFLLDFCLNSPYFVWLEQDAEESNVRQKQVKLQKESMVNVTFAFDDDKITKCS
jgi:hypothetical protein